MAEYWTAEKLEEAAARELLSHGGSRDELSRLREYFRKRAQDKYQTVLIPDDMSAQSDQFSSPER